MYDSCILYEPGEGGFDGELVGAVLAMAQPQASVRATIGSKEHSRVHASQRRSSVEWLSCRPETKWLFRHLFTLAHVTNTERGWNFAIEGCSPRLQLTTYDGDQFGHYGWHMDVGRSDTSLRKVSLVVLLSDPPDFLGGELQFIAGGSAQSMALQRGTVVVFPSFLVHRVTPVVRGVRTSLVGWVCGTQPFK